MTSRNAGCGRRADTLLLSSLILVFSVTAAAGCAHRPATPSTEPRPAAAPEAPSGLVAVVQGTDVLLLEWRDNSDGETGFMVIEDCGRSGGEVLGIVGADQTRALIENFSYGLTCSFAVFALNETGISGPSNIATITNASGWLVLPRSEAERS